MVTTKYPSGIQISNYKNINYANRGMSLEYDINSTNEYYRNNDIAYIYKKPTPIKITKTDYTNKKAIIKEAFFESPSTTDYNGIYKGKYIDFDAKETNKKTSFPLANIHKHQLLHLKNISKHGGIGFLIIRFNTIQKTYLLTNDNLLSFLNNNKTKSIPIDYFQKNAYLIEEKFNPRIDYLEAIDTIYGGKNEKN